MHKPGQFTGEYVVEARDFQNKLFSLFVPEEVVECEQEPIPGRTASGSLRVQKLEQTCDRVLGGAAYLALPWKRLNSDRSSLPTESATSKRAGVSARHGFHMILSMQRFTPLSMQSG